MILPKPDAISVHKNGWNQHGKMKAEFAANIVEPH